MVWFAFFAVVRFTTSAYTTILAVRMILCDADSNYVPDRWTCVTTGDVAVTNVGISLAWLPFALSRLVVKVGTNPA